MLQALIFFSAHGQNTHDALRIKYLSLSGDSTKNDSTILYAFKVRDAALKQPGNKGFNYYRSLNNIGYAYNLKELNKKARQYWLLSHKEIQKEPVDSFVATKIILYDNLKTSYLYHYPDADSAVFFTDKLLNLKSKQLGENTHQFLNVVSLIANELETNIDLATAKKYYNRALLIRQHLYGPASSEITAAVDSILSAHAIEDMVDLRQSLYGSTDSVYNYATLERIIDTLNEKDIWNALMYTVAMKDIALATYGDTSLQFHKGLQQFAYVLQHSFQDTAAAFYCYRKSLQILAKNKNEQSKNYSRSLLKLAEAHSDDGDHANAIRISYEQLKLSATLDGEDSPGYIESLTAIGRRYKDSSYRVKSTFEKSVQYLTQAINKTERYYGANSNEYAYALLVLGGTCITWGKLDSAALLYNAAHDIYKKNNYKDMYIVCRQLYMTYAYQGELAKSNAWLKKCLAIKRAAGDTLSIDYLTDIHNLVLGYISLKDWKEARNYLDSYESIITHNYQPHHSYYLTFLKLKVDFYSSSGNYEGIDSIVLSRLKVYTDSSKYFQDRSGTYSEIIDSYSQLAEVYIHQKKYDAAKLAAQQALRYMLKLNYDSVTNTESYYQLAQIHSLQNNNDSAVYYYTTALALTAKDGSNPDTEAMMDLASVYWKLNKVDMAEALMARACELKKNSMIIKMAGFSEIEKQQYNKILQNNLYKYYSLQNDLQKTRSGNTRSAYNFIIQLKGLLLNSADYLSKTIKASGNESEKQVYERLVDTRKKLSAAWQLDPDSKGIKKAFADSLQNLANNLEQELSLNSAAYASFQKQNNISFPDVQKKLHANEAAIEFVTFPYFNKTEFKDSIIYAAFIISPEKKEPDFITLPYNARLSELVGNQGVSGRGNVLLTPKTNSNAYRQLYELVWRPLQSCLQNKQKLYIAADGILNKIAFTCLQDSNQYLMDQYELHFVSSTKDIVLQKETALLATPAISLFGGAFFDKDSTLSVSETKTWKYLPGTLTEVKNIDRLVKTKMTVQQFTGTNASENNFKRLSGNGAPDILHIATHGYYFPRQTDSVLADDPNIGSYQFSGNSNPLVRTGLLLSNASQTWQGAASEEGTEDGVLTAYELANMDLGKTQLAVLSACETGMGDIQNGEGVYGLQRALKQAGVHKMIVSLWSVPDKETSEMMQLFYGEIGNGLPVATAFRNAQQKMRKKYQRFPAYWGAFTLVE